MATAALVIINVLAQPESMTYIGRLPVAESTAAFAFGDRTRGLAFGEGLLYRTADGGVTWTRVEGLSNFGFECLTSAELNLAEKGEGWLRLPGCQRLFWTSDFGVRWTEIDTHLFQRLPPNPGALLSAIAPLTTSSKFLGAGCDIVKNVTEANRHLLNAWPAGFIERAALFEFDGSRWHPLPFPEIWSSCVQAISLGPDGSGVAETGFDIYFTRNLGQGWKRSKFSRPSEQDRDLRIAGFVRRRNEILVVCRDGWVGRSLDGGATWTSAAEFVALTSDPGGMPRQIQIAVESTKVLWAIDRNGRIRRSTDGGVTWSRAEVQIEAFQLDCTGGGICRAATSRGLVMLRTARVP
jgi:hypothetical protein